MKWFAHEVDASENKKIRRIEAWGRKLHPEFGAIYATGLFFRLLEVISRHGEMFRLPDDYGLDLIASDLRTTEEGLERFLDFLAQINAIDSLAWDKKIVFCPKLAERVDRYTDEMLKATIAGITDGTTITYELLGVVRVLSHHPDPRKRTYYVQALHRLCTDSAEALEPEKNPQPGPEKPGKPTPSTPPPSIPPPTADPENIPESLGNNPAQSLHSPCADPAPGKERKGKERKGSNKGDAPKSPPAFSCECFEISQDYLEELAKAYPVLPKEYLLSEFFPRMRDWCLDNRNVSKHRQKFDAQGRLKAPRSCFRTWLKNEDPAKVGHFPAARTPTGKLNPALQGLVAWNEDQDRREGVLDVEPTSLQ